MADNLESYFKKHLSKDSPAEDNWNVPSDDVWDKVLPKITKKKGLFIPWRYLYILAIIVLAGLAYFLWPTDHIDTSLNYETQELISERYLDTDQNVENTSTNMASNLNTEQTTTENPSVETLAPSNTSFVSVREEEQADESTSSQSSDINLLKLNQNTTHNIPDHYISTPVSVFEARETTKIASILPITIEFNPPSIDHTILANNIFIPVNPAEPEKKKPEPFNNRGKFGIGLFFTPTFTSTYLKGDVSDDVLIETSNMFLYSNNWGFEVRYHLSNSFVLVSGVEKSEVRSWSKSLVDFGYDTSTEHMMETGEKENTSPVPMPTPFGEIDTEITYRFPGNQDIPDGEMMNSVLETHQDVRYLSIPFGIEYNILQFSHFNWFTEGGIRYNRALKDGTSFTSRILHEGHDMDVVGEIITTYPSYSLNYLNYYLGTGINYQFSKAFQLNGSARYFGNITKVNIQDNLATNVRGFNFKIGIVYIF